MEKERDRGKEESETTTWQAPKIKLPKLIKLIRGQCLPEAHPAYRETHIAA